MFPDAANLTADAPLVGGRLSVAPPRTKRVLITGVGRFWGANLARLLENDHSLEFLVGIDTGEPQGEFRRTEVVRGDIRDPAIARLLEVTRVDTVVHTQIFGADRPGESARLLHDMNVIGTMNLLAACARSANVRKVVIRSSTAMYGASPHDPAFFREEATAVESPRDLYSRDIGEVEAYARDFSERAPHAAVTILRFANSIGEHVDTALTRYLSAQVVPTWAGYNPRLQFISESDAVNALAHSVREWKPGIFNIAGPGTISLRKFLRLAGRIALPILPPVMSPALSLLTHAGLLHVPTQYRDLLRFGRGVSTRRMRDELGFLPEFTTREAAEAFAAYTRVKRYQEPDDSPLFDNDLVDYVQRKMKQMPNLTPDTLAWLTGRSTEERQR